MATNTEEEGNNFTCTVEGVQDSQTKTFTSGTSSHARPDDKQNTLDQIIDAASMKQAKDLKQMHKTLQSSPTLKERDNTLKTTTHLAGDLSAMGGGELPQTSSSGTDANANKSSPLSSGEQSSRMTEDDRTSSPTNWDDVIIDEKMIMEALTTTQLSGNRSTVDTSLRSIPDSEIDSSLFDIGSCTSDEGEARDKMSLEFSQQPFCNEADESKPVISSGEQSSGLAQDSGTTSLNSGDGNSEEVMGARRTYLPNSGDALVDAMVMEALQYVQSNSGISSGEQSSGLAEGSVTASLNSGDGNIEDVMGSRRTASLDPRDTLVDDMVMEAFQYVQSNSGISSGERSSSLAQDVRTASLTSDDDTSEDVMGSRRTALLNSGDTLVDAMIMEALQYASEAREESKEHDGHSFASMEDKFIPRSTPTSE